jgi:hypothetical protein
LVQQIFEEHVTEALRGAIIWIPMLPADSLDAANGRELHFSDRRLVQVWDAERSFGQALARTLALESPIAWDVYLVYPNGAAWDAELPPVPALWMHQLDEAPDLRLDPARLKQYILTLLERNSLDG